MKVVEDMRDLAKNQAIKSLALVKEAQGRAKETGEDEEKILGMMVLARLEAAATVKVQGMILAKAYEDAYQRVVLVGNGIASDQAILKPEIVNRLKALADNLNQSMVRARETTG